MVMIFLSVVSMAMYYMSDHSAPSTRSRAERVEQDNSAVQKDIQESKREKKQKVRKLFCLKRRLILIIMQNNRKNETTTSKNVTKET